MIKLVSGNILKVRVEALVNPVNTVGIMGGGLALQFKQTYPTMFHSYKKACDDGLVKLGKMHVFDLGTFASSPKFIINFPTKDHWRSKSQKSDIELGLIDLLNVIELTKIKSIAIPALGCGLGGLEWSEIHPTIESALYNLTDVSVLLFNP